MKHRNYSVGNKIMHYANPCDYHDAYILVKGDMSTIGRNLATEVAFKS